MVKYFNLFKKIILLIIMILTLFACSKQSGIVKHTKPAIPDGELLRYGYYVKGEKKEDIYLVTKKVYDKSGKYIYHIYLKDVLINEKAGDLHDYEKWPTYFIIDPVKGQVIEAEELIPAQISNGADYDILKSLRHWHFKSNFDKNYVEYTADIEKNNKLTIKNIKVPFNPNFPLWDATSFGFVGSRIMDDTSPGVAFMVQPLVMQKPISLVSKYDKPETIKTKLGKFSARKIIYTNTDPFFSVLMESYDLTSIKIWVDEKDTRIIVRMIVPWMTMDIEEISSIESLK
jgi:hypothetical protein